MANSKTWATRLRADGELNPFSYRSFELSGLAAVETLGIVDANVNFVVKSLKCIVSVIGYVTLLIR